MENDLHVPADTRTMGIVHSALRRDLERTRMVLADEPHPEGARRRAIAHHLLWMMQFLHRHHNGEDVGLWPLIRSKNPAAAALLDRMEADHLLIAPELTVLEECARAYRDDGSARESLVTSLARLTHVLLPHLEREEIDMMPVVAATITNDEYQAVEEKYFVGPKGFLELGAEGHWIIDGLSPDDRDVILHLVPPVPRFVLLHAFARSYRRKCALLWGNGSAARLPSLTLARMRGA